MTISDAAVQTGAGRRLSLTNSIATLGNKLSRVRTTDSASSVATNDPSAKDRSQSRGRTAFASSGRGGAGNIRSVSRDPGALGPTAEIIEDNGAIPRGREVTVSAKAISSGRGGAGNIRSPSQASSTSPSASRIASGSTSDNYEREVLAKRLAESQTEVRSCGRGGAGNIVSSRSQSRGAELSQSPAAMQRRSQSSVSRSGRGGAGNILNLPIYEGTKTRTAA